MASNLTGQINGYLSSKRMLTIPTHHNTLTLTQGFFSVFLLGLINFERTLL